MVLRAAPRSAARLARKAPTALSEIASVHIQRALSITSIAIARASASRFTALSARIVVSRLRADAGASCSDLVNRTKNGFRRAALARRFEEAFVRQPRSRVRSRTPPALRANDGRSRRPGSLVGAADRPIRAASRRARSHRRQRIERSLSARSAGSAWPLGIGPAASLADLTSEKKRVADRIRCWTHSLRRIQGGRVATTGARARASRANASAPCVCAPCSEAGCRCG